LQQQLQHRQTHQQQLQHQQTHQQQLQQLEQQLYLIEDQKESLEETIPDL
tara:strand:- start:45 stop:194 length:150 start_codon:yes stop_codon:yes gene_type:complete